MTKQQLADDQANPLDDEEYVRQCATELATWAKKMRFLSPRIKLCMGVVIGAATKGRK